MDPSVLVPVIISDDKIMLVVTQTQFQHICQALTYTYRVGDKYRQYLTRKRTQAKL